MTVEDIDIWRVAHALIKQHGEDAVFEAARRADALLDKGDMDGERVWLRIMKAVEWLQSTERGGHKRSLERYDWAAHATGRLDRLAAANSVQKSSKLPTGRAAGERITAKSIAAGVLFRCDPDHVPRSAAGAVSTHWDFLDSEAGPAQALGELRILLRRPNRKDATRPQRDPGGIEPGGAIETFVGFAAQCVRTVIDVEQDCVIACLAPPDQLGDVLFADGNAGVPQAVAEQMRHRTACPRDDGGYQLRHRTLRFRAQSGKRSM